MRPLRDAIGRALLPLAEGVLGAVVEPYPELALLAALEPAPPGGRLAKKRTRG